MTTQIYSSEVRLRGDASSVVQASREASEAVRNAAAEMRSALPPATQATGAAVRAMADQIKSANSDIGASIETMRAIVSRGMLGIGGAIAVVGGAIGAFALRAARDLDQFNDVADRTQLSVEQVSSLKNTLAPFGYGLGDIENAVTKMNRALSGTDDDSKRATRALQAIGVATKNADGTLRDGAETIRDVARALAGYEDGSRKAALVTAIFGSGGAALIPLLKDLAQAKEKDGTVTTKAAEESEKLLRAMTELKGGTERLTTSIGSWLIPKINELIQQFIVGKEAAGGFFAALGRYGLSGTDPAAKIKDLMGRLDELNAKIKADRALADGESPTFGRGARSAARARIDSNSAEIDQIGRDLQYWRLLAEQRGVGTPNLRSDAMYGTGGVTPAPSVPQRDRAGRAGTDPTAALARSEQQAIESYERMAAGVDRLSASERLEFELAQGRYQQFRDGARDRLRDVARTLDANRQNEVSADAALRRLRDYEQAEAQQSKEAEAALAKQNEELDRAAQRWGDIIDPTRAYMRQLTEIRALVASGRLTPQQGISAEFDVENRRQDEIDGKGNALTKPPKIEWLGTLEGGFRQLFTAIEQGSITARGVFTGALGLMGSVASNTLSKMASEWIATEVGLTGVKAAQAGVRAGIDAGAAATSVATNAGAASTNIMTSAWEAMAGAYKAIAGIPYVGPVLAPVAAGTAFAAVSAIAGNVIRSARDGYDIPRGVNPMVQLHEQEMVLPAAQANVVRDMADGGGAGRSRATQVNVNISAVDAQSVGRLFQDNRRELALALRQVVRDGVR